MHEKREALDAIELLKLFAKHKGISIEIAADADSPDQTTITTDENSSDGPATNSEKHNNSITMKSNQMESMKNTTKAENGVIQMQPAPPVTNVQLSNVPSSDDLLIEHATPIGIKKNTPDI